MKCYGAKINQKPSKTKGAGVGWEQTEPHWKLQSSESRCADLVGYRSEHKDSKVDAVTDTSKQADKSRHNYVST